jgi:hypothetical protein
MANAVLDQDSPKS